MVEVPAAQDETVQCQACGACCSYSAEWPRFSLESDADLNGIITNGKGKMPKYDGKLTKDQVSDLVKYIRTLKH